MLGARGAVLGLVNRLNWLKMVKKQNSQAPEEGVSGVYGGSALSSKALVFSLNVLVRKLPPHLHGGRVTPVTLLSGLILHSPTEEKARCFL